MDLGRDHRGHVGEGRGELLEFRLRGVDVETAACRGGREELLNETQRHAPECVERLVGESVREPAFDEQPEYALVVEDDTRGDRRPGSEEPWPPRMTHHHVARGKAALA